MAGQREASLARKAASTAIVRGLPFDGDDPALVEAMLRGRADARAAFYDRYVKAVHSLAFRLMGPDSELEDVVHDVFVRALESLPRLRDPSALRSWVLGVTVHVARIRFQRRSRQRWLRFMAPEDVPEMAAFPDTEIGDALREVHEILRNLDTEERIALVLHRVEGLGLEDAAAAADMSLSTFRRRLARAEAKFFARAKSRPVLEPWIAEGKKT